MLILLLISCKTSRVTLSTNSSDIDTSLIIIQKDSIGPVVEEATPVYITSTGDTVLSLTKEVEIGIGRVRKDTISIAAVGDIMMGTNFPSSSYLPPDGGYRLWYEVEELLTSADITFGNLEGVILTDGGEQKECRNPKACFLFRTPDSLAFHFKEKGFDLISTANNHANDFGVTGRVNTQSILDSLQIAHAGSLETPFQIMKRKEISIGFVAFAPNKGTNLIHNTNSAIATVTMLDSLSDIVIVSFHAGAEGAKNQHVTRKKEFYFGEDRGNVYEFSHLMIDNGADVVLGHGPHVVRGIEVYQNRLIAYSLGNFLTYGRFNLRGPNAYAPVLEVNVDPEGSFISGMIHSYIQDYNYGPLKDSRLRATKSIKELSEIDFPENEIYIEDSGRILYLDR